MGNVVWEKQKGPIIRINILCEGRTKASIKYEAGLQFQLEVGQTRKPKPSHEIDVRKVCFSDLSLFILPAGGNVVASLGKLVVPGPTSNCAEHTIGSYIC